MVETSYLGPACTAPSASYKAKPKTASIAAARIPELYCIASPTAALAAEEVAAAAEPVADAAPLEAAEAAELPVAEALPAAPVALPVALPVAEAEPEDAEEEPEAPPAAEAFFAPQTTEWQPARPWRSLG